MPDPISAPQAQADIAGSASDITALRRSICGTPARIRSCRHSHHARGSVSHHALDQRVVGAAVGSLVANAVERDWLPAAGELGCEHTRWHRDRDRIQVDDEGCCDAASRCRPNQSRLPLPRRQPCGTARNAPRRDRRCGVWRGNGLPRVSVCTAPQAAWPRSRCDSGHRLVNLGVVQRGSLSRPRSRRYGTGSGYWPGHRIDLRRHRPHLDAHGDACCV
jgi:hypothetical protein